MVDFNQPNTIHEPLDRYQDLYKKEGDKNEPKKPRKQASHPDGIEEKDIEPALRI